MVRDHREVGISICHIFISRPILQGGQFPVGIFQDGGLHGWGRIGVFRREESRLHRRMGQVSYTTETSIQAGAGSIPLPSPGGDSLLRCKDSQLYDEA